MTRLLVLLALAAPVAPSLLDDVAWHAKSPFVSLRSWFTEGMKAVEMCYPQRGTEDPRVLCEPRVLEGVLTAKEADALVEAAAGWYRRPNEAHRTEEVETSDLPAEQRAVVAKARDAVASAFREHCGAGADIIEVASSIKKYDASAPGSEFGAGLPQHRDHGRFSATILIGDKFRGGGGTRFGNRTLAPRKGSAVVHGAMVPHGSDPVKSGTRIILALFLDESYCNTAADFQLEALVALATAIGGLALGWILFFADLDISCDTGDTAHQKAVERLKAELAKVEAKEPESPCS